MEQVIGASLPWSNGGTYQESPYADLAAGIVGQASKDYIKVLGKLYRKNVSIQGKRKLVLKKLELEEFFHSDWYEMLTDIDPDCLLNECRNAVLTKEKKSRQRQEKKRTKAIKTENEENDQEENTP